MASRSSSLIRYFDVSLWWSLRSPEYTSSFSSCKIWWGSLFRRLENEGEFEEKHFLEWIERINVMRKVERRFYSTTHKHFCECVCARAFPRGRKAEIRRRGRASGGERESRRGRRPGERSARQRPPREAVARPPFMRRDNGDESQISGVCLPETVERLMFMLMPPSSSQLPCCRVQYWHSGRHFLPILFTPRTKILCALFGVDLFLLNLTRVLWDRIKRQNFF